MSTPAKLLAAPLTLVVVAAVAGLVWPSDALAERADLILAVLVLAVALGIDTRRLVAARNHPGTIAAAVVLPLAVLLPLALGLAALFDGDVQDGLLALGLSSSEVAAAGLVALAGGDAALALAVVALSLVLTAVAAPLLGPLLAGAGVDAGELVLRFSLVVLVPLAAGLALRARFGSPRLEACAEWALGPLLALLVYAGLAGVGEPSGLAQPLAAAALFLAGSALCAGLAARASGALRVPVAFTFGLRDFAVAAALATQLGGDGAAATPAVYGVLMLLLATALAPLLRPG